MSSHFWYRNLDDLSTLSYSIYAIDLPGWGRSSRPPFHGTTPSDALTFHLQALHDVISALNLPPFTLLGHSLGAYLALEYAQAHPASVSRLILVSPAAATRALSPIRAAYFAVSPQMIVRRGGLLGYLIFLMYYPRAPSYTRDRLREYTYHLALQYPPSGELAVRPMVKWTGRRAEVVRPLVENLRVFGAPVEIVIGDRDSSVPVEGVFELYREMRRCGFQVGISVVEDSDHCPMLERPEEFFNIISGLRKRDVKASGGEGCAAGDN